MSTAEVKWPFLSIAAFDGKSKKNAIWTVQKMSPDSVPAYAQSLRIVDLGQNTGRIKAFWTASHSGHNLTVEVYVFQDNEFVWHHEYRLFHQKQPFLSECPSQMIPYFASLKY